MRDSERQERKEGNAIDWASVESRALQRLKPFQRRTAEWAFDCLYPSNGQTTTGRFLVADEAGLGKTLVARGVLAKSLRHLRENKLVGRIDVVYICSNADIARQNLARLRIPEIGDDGFRSQGRLTLMPLIPRPENGQPIRAKALPLDGINFQSMTPGTSLDFRSDSGQALERALICLMLRDQIPGVRLTPLKNFLTSQVSRERFDELLERVEREYVIDEKLQQAFVRAVRREAISLEVEIRRVAEMFPRQRQFRAHEPEQQAASKLIADLRRALAGVCIDELEPDLIILDEFQRFQHLLDSHDEDARLARMLFEHEHPGRAARVLLLSATPYRMCSLAEDAGDTQHYDEFLATIRFLMRDDEASLQILKADLAAFNDAIRTMDPAAPDTVRRLRISLQNRLSRLMSRTDRVPATARRDAMISTPPKLAEPVAEDLVAYVNLQRVAEALKQPDLVEYWRSAPFPLSFLSGYKLRDRLKVALAEEEPHLVAAIDREGLFLGLDPLTDASSSHARTRAMVSELIAAGMHRMLWIPPALPCYAPGGAFASISEAARTKRLLFSSWRMVPRAVSTVVDAMLVEAIRKGLPPREFVRHEETEGDYSLGYPASVLARDVVPMKIAREIEANGLMPGFDAVVGEAQRILESRLQAVRDRFSPAEGGTTDSSWYWLAPALMDFLACENASQPADAQPFADHALDVSMIEKRQDSAAVWIKESQDRRRVQLKSVLEGGPQPGRMPDDLAEVVARMAVASPAVCALRAMKGGDDQLFDPSTRQIASAMGAAFAHYLSHEHAVALVSELHPETAFWRSALLYCGNGCLQAVLDEYFAILRDDKAINTNDIDAMLQRFDCLDEVLRLKPAVLRPEILRREGDGRLVLASTPRSLRRARPLLEDRTDGDPDDGGTTPIGRLRTAFNSPFFPFVLSSTSIGQEGLDFHWYCHAIVHWNLPANPVDFEQRDGRIHRYRNHAVRRNLARDWGGSAAEGPTGPAVWDWMFGQAGADVAKRGADLGGMRPAWIYQCGDGEAPDPSPAWMQAAQGDPASIERHVPQIPLSKDTERLTRMNQAVGCYRMVFAQPRQDDLMAHLQRCHAPTALETLAAEVSIDLRPPSNASEQDSARVSW